MLHGFTDVDFGGDLDDHRSMLGLSSLVAWRAFPSVVRNKIQCLFLPLRWSTRSLLLALKIVFD